MTRFTDDSPLWMRLGSLALPLQKSRGISQVQQRRDLLVKGSAEIQPLARRKALLATTATLWVGGNGDNANAVCHGKPLATCWRWRSDLMQSGRLSVSGAVSSPKTTAPRVLLPGVIRHYRTTARQSGGSQMTGSAFGWRTTVAIQVFAQTILCSMSGPDRPNSASRARASGSDRAVAASSGQDCHSADPSRTRRIALRCDRPAGCDPTTGNWSNGCRDRLS
jgi:hypothetical protein